MRRHPLDVVPTPPIPLHAGGGVAVLGGLFLL